MGLYYECGNGFVSISFAKKDMGCDAYLCCPGPSLKDVDPKKLRGKGRKIFGINTTYPYVKPDVWLGMDSIDCYDRNILYEPFIKIFRGPFFDRMMFDGKPVKYYPDTYWAKIKEPESGKTMYNYREHKINFAWHKSTLMVAIHMMIWMGARNIYLLGCDLGGTKDYFHDKKLNDEQKKYNKRLYKSQSKHLEGIVQEGKSRGVKFYSCTPNSPINKFMEYVQIDEALKKSEEKTKFSEENTIKHVLETHRPITVACLYKTGAYLNDEYVYKLKKSVEKYLPKAKFVCLTDKDKIDGVNTISLKYGWYGVFSKLELFEHFKGRTLYIDLSSKVKKDLVPLTRFSNKFTMIKDFVNSDVRSSAVMGWDGDYSFITKKFKENPLKYMKEYAPLKGEFSGKKWKSCVDQKFIQDTVGLKNINTWNPNWISSYKFSNKEQIDNSSIIVYHGKPKPHEVNWETYRPGLLRIEEKTTPKTKEEKALKIEDDFISSDSGIKILNDGGKNPEVTVIIPYNKNRGWLKQAIDSVPKENVQLILSKGQDGWCENFNKALPLAVGEYVRFLHEDDKLTENSIQDSLKAIKTQEVDFIHGNSMDYHVDGYFKNDKKYKYRPWHPKPQIPTVKDLKKKNIMQGGTVLYKKSVFNRVGLFDETIPHAMEFEFNLRCLHGGLKLGYCDSYLYVYRRHKDQMVNKTKKTWADVHNNIISRFEEEPKNTILHITNWGIWGGVQSVVLSISKEYNEYDHRVFSINSKGEQKDTINHFEKNGLAYKSFNEFITHEDVKKINPKLIFLHSTRAKFLENDGEWLKNFKTIRVHHGWNLGPLHADLNWFVSGFVFKKLNYKIDEYFILPPVTYVKDYLNIKRPQRKPVVGRIQSQTAIGGKPFPEKFYDLIKKVDADTFIVSPEDTSTKNSFRNAKIMPGKMQEYLKEVDVFVIWQDKIETWCLVATEANLSGIPVIARDINDGLSEQLKKSGGGVLVKTEEEFLNKVNELINNPELRENITKKGKNWCIENVNTKRLRITLKNFITTPNP